MLEIQGIKKITRNVECLGRRRTTQFLIMTEFCLETRRYQCVAAMRYAKSAVRAKPPTSPILGQWWHAAITDSPDPRIDLGRC